LITDTSGFVPVLFVNASATGQNTGSSWADAMTDLRRAFNSLSSLPLGTEIWVAAGTYPVEQLKPAAEHADLWRVRRHGNERFSTHQGGQSNNPAWQWQWADSGL